jgi:hypothetical protein
VSSYPEKLDNRLTQLLLPISNTSQDSVGICICVFYIVQVIGHGRFMAIITLMADEYVVKEGSVSERETWIFMGRDGCGSRSGRGRGRGSLRSVNSTKASGGKDIGRASRFQLNPALLIFAEEKERKVEAVVGINTATAKHSHI